MLCFVLQQIHHYAMANGINNFFNKFFTLLFQGFSKKTISYTFFVNSTMFFFN